KKGTKIKGIRLVRGDHNVGKVNIPLLFPFKLLTITLYKSQGRDDFLNNTYDPSRSSIFLYFTEFSPNCLVLFFHL
ncbi:MAG: hypothetical protein KGV48_003220, partial [Alcaligenaceae bacterium]|nr:hypothetical protein [Alcaligenaceae bacterium]